MASESPPVDYHQLGEQIKGWARDLGFQGCGIADTELDDHEAHLMRWLDDGFHGQMDYMQRHGSKRARPEQLVPGTLRVISVRMDYLPPSGADSEQVMDDSQLGFVSRYALGRDYHKLIRKRLQRLADQIQSQIGEFGYRAFVDSAPVLEKALAEKAGLGWIGKHSNLLHDKIGSWFFLGELYTDLPLPVDQAATNHCGSCQRCIDVCPTQAIVGPYKVDARRCISYLTIELRESIPEELRPLMGNRIYGCDDCQLICPWNKFAQPTGETAFQPRHQLDSPDLIELFAWTEEEFLRNTEGSAIRRIGHDCWLRNIAVALGNALRQMANERESASEPKLREILAALQDKQQHPSALVREHSNWALAQWDA